MNKNKKIGNPTVRFKSSEVLSSFHLVIPKFS